MNDRLFITIRILSQNELLDLEVPTSRNIYEIFPLILKSINYPLVNPLDQAPFALWQQNGNKLNMNQSFRQAGVSNFEILILDSKPPVPAINTARVLELVESQTIPEVQDKSTDKENDQEEKTPLNESIQIKKNVKKRVQDLVAIPKAPGIIKTRKP